MSRFSPSTVHQEHNEIEMSLIPKSVFNSSTQKWPAPGKKTWIMYNLQVPNILNYLVMSLVCFLSGWSDLGRMP